MSSTVTSSKAMSESESGPAADGGTINTGKVTGRRELHFNKIDDIRAEAERLAAGSYRQLGNWTLGQTFSHLAAAIKLCLDGASFRVPFYIRWFAPLIKKKLLRGPMKPGFKLPRDASDGLIPANTVSMEQGLNELRTTIERLHREPVRKPSPIFGKMTNAEWDQLHLRHAELHLGFYVPK
ncbi:MAG TPA: DUF1569 domain-containing protein [Pirellulales bacterium]